jgi:histidinol-phosphate phosphatase family protein
MTSQALIIAGGKGTRLQGITQDIPKPMFPVNGKPVLQHQVELLKANGILRILILTGYLGERITEYFGDGGSFGVHVTYCQEEAPLGTAGCVRQCADAVDSDFIVLYGDLIFDMRLADLSSFHLSKKATATLVVHPNDHPHDSDLVVLDEEDRIRSIIQKKEKPEYYPNCASAGLYVLSRRVLDYIPQGRSSDFVKDVFPQMLEKDEGLYGYRTAEYVKDMGTVDRLERTGKDLKNGKVHRLSKNVKRPAVFMDRDGTVIKAVNLLCREEDLDLYPFTASALQKLNQSEYLSILITNQPVVARNLCSMDDVRHIHNKMETLLGRENVYFNDIYFCPHHPDSGYPEENKAYKIDCTCRKPKTGMIERATVEYNVDLSSSWIIGDTTTDIQTGINAGIKTILVRTGEGGKDGKWQVLPDFIFDNLDQAVDFILEQNSGYADRIAGITNKIVALHRKSKSVVVAVGGQARSGKSTFAALLKDNLERQNIACRQISLDNWLIDRDQRTADMTVRDRFRYEDIARDLHHIIVENGTVDVGLYNTYHRTVNLDTTFSLNSAACLIVEGVPALDIAELRVLSQVKVFVECDETLRMERFLTFYGWKDLPENEIKDMLDARLRDEVPFIDESKKYADFIVPMP